VDVVRHPIVQEIIRAYERKEYRPPPAELEP
jgi:phosphate starvation-inducible protein PhoH